MFKVFLGFVLALAVAIVIRVVYDMGRRNGVRQTHRLILESIETMVQIDTDVKKKKQTVKKKK